jgi:hypothetical protein
MLFWRGKGLLKTRLHLNLKWAFSASFESDSRVPEKARIKRNRLNRWLSDLSITTSYLICYSMYTIIAATDHLRLFTYLSPEMEWSRLREARLQLLVTSTTRSLIVYRIPQFWQVRGSRLAAARFSV